MRSLARMLFTLCSALSLVLLLAVLVLWPLSYWRTPHFSYTAVSQLADARTLKHSWSGGVSGGRIHAYEQRDPVESWMVVAGGWRGGVGTYGAPLGGGPPWTYDERRSFSERRTYGPGGGMR